MSKLTRWFPRNVKPVRPGVYRTRFDGWAGYCKWNGKRWANQATTINEAARMPFAGAKQRKDWRGLAADPEVKS